MPFYRTYVLDEHGHVVIAIDLECVDDDEAIARASRLGDSEVELWRRVPLAESDSPRHSL
jgi:hypothetical protein